jgi:hypothetical protein
MVYINFLLILFHILDSLYPISVRDESIDNDSSINERNLKHFKFIINLYLDDVSEPELILNIAEDESMANQDANETIVEDTTAEAIFASYNDDQNVLGIEAPIDASQFKVPRGRPKKRGGRRSGAGKPKTIFGATDIQEIDDSESNISSAGSSRTSTPVRRSPRISSIISTTSTKSNSSIDLPKLSDITGQCHTLHSKHFGIFCGAKSANHKPIYYNTLAPVFLHINLYIENC